MVIGFDTSSWIWVFFFWLFAIGGIGGLAFLAYRAIRWLPTGTRRAQKRKLFVFVCTVLLYFLFLLWFLVGQGGVAPKKTPRLEPTRDEEQGVVEEVPQKKPPVGKGEGIGRGI